MNKIKFKSILTNAQYYIISHKHKNTSPCIEQKFSKERLTNA